MGGWPRPLIGVHPVGISAREGAWDEILGLWASFWLCFWVNHKEIQNSIFHVSLRAAWQPDFLLRQQNIIAECVWFHNDTIVLAYEPWIFCKCLQNKNLGRERLHKTPVFSSFLKIFYGDLPRRFAKIRLWTFQPAFGFEPPKMFKF